MQDETDYAARSAFLYFTTEVMTPVPIDILLELLPIFHRWRARLDREDPPDGPLTGDRIMAVFELATRTISPLDDSPEAVALKDALSGWMARCNFRDPWLADAGLCTLFVQHSNGVASPRKWYLQPPYEELCPIVRINLRQEFGESRKEFLKRLEREYRQRRKEYNAPMEFRTGERANQMLPARWAALVFAGSTFAEIARANNRARGYVRKTVVGFARRAGLTLPKTLRRQSPAVLVFERNP
jgi:hypothetical protein